LVAGIIGEAASFCKNFEQGDLAVSLVDQRMTDGPNNRNGLALSFPDGNAYLGMRN
jgi:hypothetical protein